MSRLTRQTAALPEQESDKGVHTEPVGGGENV